MNGVDHCCGDEVQLLIGQLWIAGQGDLVVIVLVGLRIVLYLITQSVEEGEHGQGDEVHVDSHLALRNLVDDLVALLFGDILDAQGIDMIGGLSGAVVAGRQDAP